MPNSSLGEMHFPETHLIPLVIQTSLGMRDHIEVFGDNYETIDGTCIRDYIHVCDLADAHVRCLEIFSGNSNLLIEKRIKSHKDNYFIFNLGNGNPVSVKEIINHVERIAEKRIKVIYSSRRLGDPPVLVASSKKIEYFLGWKPKFKKIEKIIEDAYNWHKKTIN